MGLLSVIPKNNTRRVVSKKLHAFKGRGRVQCEIDEIRLHWGHAERRILGMDAPIVFSFSRCFLCFHDEIHDGSRHIAHFFDRQLEFQIVKSWISHFQEGDGNFPDQFCAFQVIIPLIIGVKLPDLGGHEPF